MSKFLLFLFILISISSCDYYFINAHKYHVGVIKDDRIWKDNSFELCYEEKIFPGYYGKEKAGFAKSKDTLINYFNHNYNNNGFTNITGYVTIRFIINCKGEAGRFVIKEVGPDFKNTKFNAYITDHLLELVQELKAWKPIVFNDYPYDSFNHITFKLVNGEIAEILS